MKKPEKTDRPETKKSANISRRLLVGLAAVLVIVISGTFVFVGLGGADAFGETLLPLLSGQIQIKGTTNQGSPSAGDTQTVEMTTPSSGEATTSTLAETLATTAAGSAAASSQAETTLQETTTSPSTTAKPAATTKPTTTKATTAATTAAPTEPVAPVALAGTGKINILLIGSDARAGLDGQRSDSMIMLTLDRDASQIKLTSFMRDMYVAIPEHGSSKLNAAFNYGGESLLIKTLKNNFAIDLDNYITIRFESFIAVVDQIGGISLNLTQKEIDYINAEIGGVPDGEGVKQLTGAQTLSHCRNRHVGNGDFTRTARQRAAIQAIFTKIKQQHDVVTLANLVSFAVGNVKTNVSRDQLLALSTEILGNNDISFREARVPFDGTWEYATKSGASVIAVDFSANQERLRQFLNG